MLHTWCMVRVNDEGINGFNITDRIVASVNGRISFHPDDIFAHKFGDNLYIVSVSSNVSSYGDIRPQGPVDNGWLFKDGCPTFEHPDFSEAGVDINKKLADLLKNRSYRKILCEIGGAWNISLCFSDRLIGMSSFCGLNPIYFSNAGGVSAISNDPLFLSGIINSGKDELNLGALSWLYSTTMIIGEETPFKDVYRVPSGNVIEIDGNGLRFVDISDEYLSFNIPEREFEDFFRYRVEIMSSRIKWLTESNIKLLTQLTGGKDSRAILAILMGSGVVDKIEKIQTFGAPDNGDRIVAEMISEALGIRHLHESRENLSKAKDVDSDAIFEKIDFSFGKYGGLLTPFDGAMGPAAKKSSIVTLNGTGGAIYKDKGLRYFSDAQTVDVLKSWSWKYDKLGVLSEQAIQYQSEVFRRIVRSYSERNVVNIDSAFFLEQRHPNWASAFNQRGAAPLFTPLVDIGLSRYMHQDKNIHEDVHFNIIRMSCSKLLEFPFLNDNWKGGTRDLAARLNMDKEPLIVPMNKNYPWQFSFYENNFHELVNRIIKNYDIFSDFVDYGKLLGFYSNGLRNFNSADIKMVLGMNMIISAVDGGFIKKRDFYKVDIAPSGNLSNIFGFY